MSAESRTPSVPDAEPEYPLADAMHWLGFSVELERVDREPLELIEAIRDGIDSPFRETQAEAHAALAQLVDQLGAAFAGEKDSWDR